MKRDNGTVILEKINFSENEFAIGLSSRGDASHPNTRTRAWNKFMNICIGHPNMTLYKTKEKRDERYDLAIKMLSNAHYTIEEVIR